MSTSSAPGPPPGGDENRAGQVIAIYWIQMFFAVSIVSLRMWARKYSRSIGWDDWLMLLTLAMQLVLAGLVTHFALIGGTRHLYYLTPSESQRALKWSYILQCWGILAFSPPKASVAILIARIMHPFRGWRFWTLVVAVSIVVLNNVLDAIFTYVQCNPAAALWDHSIKDAKCWPPSIQANISIYQASFNVFVDALLALLPVTILYKLQMSMRRKLMSMALLGLGLFAAVAGAVKTSTLSRLTAHSDLTWKMYDLVILTGTENWIVLMCGSVAPLLALKPLWTKHVSSKAVLSSLHPFRDSRSKDETSLAGEDMQLSGLKTPSISTGRTTVISVDTLERGPEKW